MNDLIKAVKELLAAAQPISQQHATEPDEYVIPAERLEELRAAINEAEQ